MGLKRFINKGIFVIDVISYYLQLEDPSIFLVLNSTGKLKYQENACNTWCLWRVSHHCMFFHATVTSEKSYPQKWWKQSICDDLWSVMVNDELFLCYLCFANAGLGFHHRHLTHTAVYGLASAPENFKEDWFADSSESLCAWHCSIWICHFWVDNKLCLTWFSIDSWQASCCKYKTYFVTAKY